MSINETQVGGSHYGPGLSYQHWDFVHDSKLDWCGGNATKYVCRWWKKNGVVDLQKAVHYLRKRQEQGIGGGRLGFGFITNAMAALDRWRLADPSIPPYEQHIIEEIIRGNNEEAIKLIDRLIANAESLTEKR